MSQPFAVFDIDGTVLRWQFYHAIVHELGRRGAMGAEADQKIREARLTWKKRAHQDSFHDYEHTLVDVYHEARSNIKATDFDSAVEHVFETYKDQVYTYTRDLIKELKSKGYLLFAVSGSQQEIVEKFGAYYGFDDVVGTRYERTKDGNLGKRLFSPVKEQGKGPVLQELIDKHDASLEGSYAVGDSLSDVAMLKMVENPIAFNPDNNLFEAATQNGWNIVVERKNMIYELHEENGHYELI
jgi:HAD superfamily hydrolase (TIGR01490 family)